MNLQKRRSIVTIAALLIMTTFIFAGTIAQAASVEPILVPGNPSCTSRGYEFGFKIEPPNSGTYNLPDGINTITITSDGTFFDWTSTIGIDAVIVKGGPNANLYVYDPPAESFGDTDLHAPINSSNNQPFGLSHIEFCYDVEPPTNTPTVTNTATDTPTSTSTNTPTDTPTNTPTDTPTNTPTDTPTNTPTDTPTNTPTDTPTSTPTDTATATPTNTPVCVPIENPCSLIRSPGFWKNWANHFSEAEFQALIAATQDYSGLTVVQAEEILSSNLDQYHRHLLAAELSVALNPQLGTAIYTVGSLAGMTVNDILHLAFITDPSLASLDLIDAVLYLGAGGENDSPAGCRLIAPPPCPTPTFTPTSTPTNTPTITPTSTPTNTPTNTPTITPTSTPTNTPTNTPTDTPTNTPTDTPTNTPTNTPTDTPTNTPTNTPTDTPTNTPTNTPTDTPTNTPTNTPTITPTFTPSNTPTNTSTPTPIPPQGCTPGYWKQSQHLDSWVATGFSPNQTLESVFDVPNTYGLDNRTLLQALSFQGGPSTTAAARILLRAAVSALLNSAHPDINYPFTTAEIIADVNAALASMDRNTMLTLARELDQANNLGCPLN